MPTRREDVLWSVVHRRASHLRALLDALDDVDMSIAYELHYYPYAIVELLRVRDDAPPVVLRSGESAVGTSLGVYVTCCRGGSAFG
jgi:hypothetical protein